MSFWRPNIWDLLGVALAVLGLVAGGTVLVSVSLGALHIVEFVLALLLIGLSIVIFSRFRESSAYPFAIHAMKTTFVFSVDPTSHVPQGRLAREMEISLRSNSPERVDRFTWLTDPPKLNEQDVRSRLNLQAGVTTGENNEISRILRPEIKLSDFRKLDMFYTLPDEVKQFRRFCFIEKYFLPNEFPNDDEYYDLIISENVKRRIIRFEFENIKVISARFAIVRGKRAPIYQDAKIEKDTTRNIIFIRHEFKNLRVGDVLSFRWSWDYGGHLHAAAAKVADPDDTAKPGEDIKAKQKADSERQREAAAGGAAE
jgi:hypothetical protein